MTRYPWETFALDDSFDHFTDYYQWMRAVCEKTRDVYVRRLFKAGV